MKSFLGGGLKIAYISAMHMHIFNNSDSMLKTALHTAAT